jgi:hypothetical protein
MVRHIGLAVLLTLAAAGVNAETILIDDFNDGNDDGWTRIDGINDLAWGPAIFDATLGAYHIESSDVVTEQDNQNGIQSDWNTSIDDPLFSQGFLRVTVSADSGSTNPYIYMRHVPRDDPRGTAYYFVGAAYAGFLGIDGGAGLIGADVWSFGPYEDWIMEAGVVEGVNENSRGEVMEGVWVTFKAWPADEDEPAEPQVRVFDRSPLPAGALGIGAWTKRGNVPISATFDDIYFTPFPEVPSLALHAGDANQDLSFDQLDLVQVLQSNKYMTGEAATWGQGDWDGAPGGEPGNPPVGDGVFDQFDIIAALGTGKYLTGPYAAGLASGAVVNAVPEPSALALVLLAFMGLLCRRW